MVGKIILKKKAPFGNVCYEPQNGLAQLLCQMLNRASLAAKWWDLLREEGFEIEVIE